MDEGIRVLLVDDSAQTRETLRNILSLEKDMTVVGEAGDGQQALVRVKELRPDVIVMDVNMPGVDGIQATERITTEFTDLSVIVMSAAGDQEYLRKAMIAGARDYLIKPFTSDEVVTAIKRVYDRERRRRQRDVGATSRPVAASKILTFYSPHDGVGKSTLAANLALALNGAMGEPTVLVDLNLQFGDLDLLLNVVPEHNISDVVPHFQNLDTSVMESFLSLHESGVRLLAAPPRPHLAETVTLYCVQQVLRVLRQAFQYVIVDASSALNDVTLAALDLSDEILLVTSLDVPSLRNTRICLETMRDLQYETEKIRVIINRATGEMGIRADEVEEYLEHPVSARVPSDGKTVVTSVNNGTPYVLANPESRVAEAVREMAQLFLPAREVYQHQAAEPARTGWAQRLVKQFLGAGAG